MKRIHHLIFAAACATAIAFPLTQGITQEGRRPATAETRATAGVLTMLPTDSVTEQTIDVGSGKLAYTATAGTFTLFDQSGERSAAIFYTAYVAKGAGQRPLTFVFNGGPGAASVYLQLGLAGPRIVEFSPTLSEHSPVRTNPDTWLKFTDLVFIDPVGTGWSRAAKADDAKHFWSVQSDAQSIAKVIALYVAKNARAGAPIFLLGESYGGYRALKVARTLQREQGLAVGGIVMLSPFLDGSLQAGARQNALGAALHLPSLAAAELDRRNAFTPEALAAAERFAMTDYLVTLAGTPPQGDTARAFYGRVAAMTGLPAEVVTRTRGFIGGEYAKHPGSGTVASHYDAAFMAPDAFPESSSAEGGDPILDGNLQALGGAFVGYARETLGFKTDMTFMLLNREISGKWDWGGGRGRVSADRDLREVLGLNRAVRVLIVHGRSDMVTPYGVTRYVLDHLPTIGDPGRVALKVYKGGHMFYLAPSERRAVSADAQAFYAAGKRKEAGE